MRGDGEGWDRRDELQDRERDKKKADGLGHAGDDVDELKRS